MWRGTFSQGLAAVLVLSLVGACDSPETGLETTSGTPVPPTIYNVVVVSVDTLRADRLSLYGYDRPTTPALDHLSREALVLEHFYSNGGGTLAAHMSLFTSLPPEVHGITGKGHRLPTGRITLAEALAARGYRTAAFTGGGYTSAVFGFDQGFDSYDDSGWGFEESLPKALTWLDAEDDRPFFLFLHSYDVHSSLEGQPYDCPGGFADLYTSDYVGDFDGCIGRRCASKLLVWLNDKLRNKEGFELSEHLSSDEMELLSSRYDGCINYADSRIGELMAHLRSRSLWKRTLFVVTSDHGEEFLDHGLLLHMQGGYEEMARLPLVIKLPDSELGGTRFSGLASLIDLGPTILSALGLQAPRQMLGRDLLPMVVGRSPSRRKVDIQGTVRSDRWKLIPGRDGDLLFDLAADPRETASVTELYPERAARFRARSDLTRARYEALRRRLGREGDTDRESIGLSADQIEKLRALGYLD